MSAPLRPRAAEPHPESVAWCLPAEPASIPQLRHHAQDEAERLTLGAAEAGAVALAVTEAATNAVLHAFVDRAPGTVTLLVEPEDGQIVFCVRDDGRGLTPRFDSPGLGLGIPLLGRLCAHFDVGPGPDGAGTEVRMVFGAPRLRVGGRADRLRARLEQSLGGLRDAVTVSEAGGGVVYANRAAVELLGAVDPDEVMAGSSSDLAARFRITLPDGDPVAQGDLPHQRVFDGMADPEPLLTRNVHLASGRVRWLLTTATPLRDDQLDTDRLAVSVIHDVTAATELARRQRFLADAGERLARSLDLEETFREVAALAVPVVADWCALDVAEPDGTLRRVALAHREPGKVALGEEIHRRFPSDPARDAGVYGVLRTGEPLFIPDLPDDLLASSIADPEHLALLREVGMRSVVVAPLAARGRAVGVLTLVTSDSARAFGPEDLELAMALARRAALAVDTAQRFADR